MKVARPCTLCRDARGSDGGIPQALAAGIGLGRPRRTNENPFYRGCLPLASVGPWFARASPAVRRSHRGRALFGEDRGEFRPHLGADAKHSRGSCSHERQADNTNDKSKDAHLLFPPTLIRTPALPSWRRSTTATPSSRSRSRICIDSAGWVTEQASAARPKCPCRASAER